MNRIAPLVLALVASGGIVLGACAPGPVAEPGGDVPRTVTSMVNASVVIGACPDARKMNAKTAAETINQLVEPCGQVPGGKAHFAAVLLPGGKIELAAPDGKVTEGVVPTCVLSHGLAHKVSLTKPCTFDVQIEERKLRGAAP